MIVREDAELFLEIVPLASPQNRRRRLPLAGKSTRRFDLSRSPDGRFFAYVDGSSLTAHVTQIFVLDRATGENVAITDGRTNAGSPSWSPDGTSLYFVSNRAGRKDVWRQPLLEGRPDGEPRPLTHDIGVRHAVVSPDGTRLAYSRGQTVANVWRVPWLEERAARWDDAEAITEGKAYVEFVSLSPDGKKLVTTSDASGNPDLWSQTARRPDLSRRGRHAFPGFPVMARNCSSPAGPSGSGTSTRWTWQTAPSAPSPSSPGATGTWEVTCSRPTIGSSTSPGNKT